MTQRCTNSNHDSYPRYGGRGIEICERWRLFENFLADMGQPPSNEHTLDRIDGSLGYSPENCRWASSIEQANNTSRNRWLTFNGVVRTVAQWAMELGCRPQLIDQRLRRGWSVERALGGHVQCHVAGARFRFDGRDLTIRELADLTKIPYKRLHKRLVTLQWDVEKAVATPGK
jgi:hypothetical protein